MIRDFEVGVDLLRLHSELGFDASLSAWQVVDQFADDSTGDVTFDFGNGNVILLDGVSSTTGLTSELEVF